MAIENTQKIMPNENPSVWGGGEKLTPFLWFDHQAEEAVQFYCSIFPDSRVLNVMLRAGAVVGISFQLEGREFKALNGGPHYQFNRAISLYVSCQTQEEIDRYWTALTAGGKEIQCGWLEDKYGLAWQIVPAQLGAWLTSSDQAKAARAWDAMLQSVKFSIATLQSAYDGRS